MYNKIVIIVILAYVCSSCFSVHVDSALENAATQIVDKLIPIREKETESLRIRVEDIYIKIDNKNITTKETEYMTLMLRHYLNELGTGITTLTFDDEASLRELKRQRGDLYDENRRANLGEFEGAQIILKGEIKALPDQINAQCLFLELGDIEKNSLVATYYQDGFELQSSVFEDFNVEDLIIDKWTDDRLRYDKDGIWITRLDGYLIHIDQWVDEYVDKKYEDASYDSLKKIYETYLDELDLETHYEAGGIERPYKIGLVEIVKNTVKVSPSKNKILWAELAIIYKNDYRGNDVIYTVVAYLAISNIDGRNKCQHVPIVIYRDKKSDIDDLCVEWQSDEIIEIEIEGVFYFGNVTRRSYEEGSYTIAISDDNTAYGCQKN